MFSNSLDRIFRTIFGQSELNFRNFFGQFEQDFRDCFRGVPDCVEVWF